MIEQIKIKGKVYKLRDWVSLTIFGATAVLMTVCLLEFLYLFL